MNPKPVALIVEDNADQNLVFTTALAQAGYKTESFEDGLSVQRRLAEITPDIVILDLHLPGINGMELLAQIRRERHLVNTRVILTTADAAMASVLQPQADLILLKPVSFSQLSQLAQRFLPATTIHNPLPSED